MSSRAANCGQSSGSAAGSRLSRSIASGAKSVGTASAQLAMMPSQTTRPNQRRADDDVIVINRLESEFLQVFDNRTLVFFRKRDAIDVAGIGVAGNRRVVFEKRLTPGLWNV